MASDNPFPDRVIRSRYGGTIRLGDMREGDPCPELACHGGEYPGALVLVEQRTEVGALWVLACQWCGWDDFRAGVFGESLSGARTEFDRAAAQVAH